MNFFFKILFLAWISYVGYWLLPLKKPKEYRKENIPNNVLATDQKCRVPCADIVIKEGFFEIPDDTLKKYPGLKLDRANIYGNSPFRPLEGILFFHYDFILYGKVGGVDSTQTDGYIPRFRVLEWYPTEYVARFWRLTGMQEKLYLINLLVGIPFFIIIVLRHRRTLFKL